jgi:hypothetical protein
MRKLSGFWFASLCLLLAPGCRAQFIGYVTPQTVSASVASNQACNAGITTIVPNLGQTVHSLTVTINADPSTEVINSVLQGSNDGTTFFAISDKGFITTINNQSILTAGGYFPVVRAVITCANASTRVTAIYSGTSVTQGPTFGDVDATYYQKILSTGLTAGAGATFPVVEPPFGSTAGFMAFNFQGGVGPAGSQLVMTCAQVGPSATPTFTFALATAAVNQVFYIPHTTCAQINVTYNSGGASGSTYQLAYFFSKPGFLQSVTGASLSGPLDAGIMAERGPRWSTTNNPAAGTQASASRAAGGPSVRHVADCVTASATASTAPAATNLGLNLRDGASGAGTIIWLTQIAAAATAATHAIVTICGLNLIGTANTAMTLEFSAGLTNEFEAVTLTGYDVE